MTDLDAELAELEGQQLTDEPDTPEPDARPATQFDVRWRGRTVTIDLESLTGLDYRLIREVLGEPLNEAQRRGGGLNMEAVCAVVWRILRRSEKLKYETVLAELRVADVTDEE